MYNISKHKAIFNSKTVWPVIFTVFLLVVVLFAIITSGRKSVLPPESMASALAFEGATVDAVIARNFGLREQAGVLVASAPTGMIAKVIDLRRGDIVLELNGVAVDDVAMLMKMMSQISGDTRTRLTVFRNGAVIKLHAGPSLYSGYQSGALNVSHVLFVLGVVFISFVLIFFNKGDRTVILSLGAVALVVFGTHMGFFDQSMAFSSINVGTLSLLVGVGFFSIFFEETNCFAFVARKIILLSEGSQTKIMLFLCAMTYLFSMFVNNLSTILIIVPITLKIAEELEMDIVPLLICEVIASNLGGASSMIGDFPNMLISSEAKLLFHDFIFFMFPICLIQLFVMFLYMQHKKWINVTDIHGKEVSGKNQKVLLKRMKAELSSINIDRDAVKKGLIFLAVVVVGFIFSDIIHVNAPTIALAGGFFLLAFGGIDPKVILRKVNFRDILFFAALFVIVGAVDASGVLSAISQTVKFISGGHLLVQAILILWISAFLTAFLNAGPAAALFIPIIFRMGAAFPNNYIWWALSLGVLAGSCSTLTGATAGAVTVSLMEDYKDTSKKKNSIVPALSFRSYAQVGVPIMFLFLTVSTIYIVMLSVF